MFGSYSIFFFSFSPPWIVNCSNYFSMIVVFASFLLMVVFILRMNGDMALGRSGVVYFDSTPQQSMIGLENPIVVKFVNDSDTLKDGVQLLVSALQPMSFIEVWGVDVGSIHNTFNKPYKELLVELDTDSFMGSESLHCNKHRISACSEKTLELPCPDNVTEENIGTVPRRRYPLAIVCSPLTIQYTHDPQVVAAMYVIHLKDGICSQKSHVIYHYIKTNTNSIFQLQSLYVNSPLDGKIEGHTETTNTLNIQTIGETYQNGNSSEETGVQTDGSPDSECVVCQCNMVHCALLPCRHACVCISCLKKLDSCPMCRTFIVSYFRISSAEAEVEDESETDTTGSYEQSENKWSRLLNRFNELFGFS